MTLPALFTRKGRLRFVRYRAILFTLPAHGFGEFTTWERVRMATEEVGPTFIELGQILSNRPDLIPRELQVELEKLQENVPPFPAKEAVSSLENDPGRSMHEIFRESNRDPGDLDRLDPRHHQTGHVLHQREQIEQRNERSVSHESEYVDESDDQLRESPEREEMNHRRRTVRGERVERYRRDPRYSLSIVLGSRLMRASLAA